MQAQSLMRSPSTNAFCPGIKEALIHVLLVHTLPLRIAEQLPRRLCEGNTYHHNEHENDCKYVGFCAIVSLIKLFPCK